ncbi:hypothetical protein CVT26_002595 [Gymnopilus dilepis]|uniref:F-box domain-containing protein n=1 Tax=Gymnopilus dilepis TaxID=231916 RepID=A0A409VF50_9AGAR|nr:hypothetical protein CVT26_002595 [Gymnopilus dilepis]
MPSVVTRLPVVKKRAFRTKPSQSALTAEEAFQRRTSNQRLPIFQLCPDLLEYVFLLAVELEADSYNLHRTVIAWSHTCHYWRLVTYSVKSLWALLIDFDERSYQWNEEMLQRSHPLPIKLSFRDQSSHRFQTLALQLSHLDRIRRYAIACQDTDWDTVVQLLEHPAPSLRNFGIVWYPSYGATPPSSPILPPSIFASTAPNLRHLTMRGCMIDFRSPLLTSLVHLKVAHLSQAFAPTAMEWLDRIRQMPSLTELILENAVSPPYLPHSPPNVMLDPDARNHLPLLSKLVLHAPIRDVSIFLQQLPIPTSHNWTITAVDCAPGADLDTIMETFSSNFRTAGSGHECPLLIAANDYDIYLRNGLLNEDRPAGAYLSFSFHAASRHFWDSLFPSIATGLEGAIPYVTALELVLPGVHPSLLPLLQRAERLNTLTRVSPQMTKYLLPQLQRSMSVGLQTYGVLLPKLERIIFADDRSMWGDSYCNLKAYLRWRQTVGFPIRNIRFLRCNILETVLKEMRSFGVEIEGEMDGFRWQNL